MIQSNLTALDWQWRWLPDMDLNHDKQIQSLLCYRYTIGQRSLHSLKFHQQESRLVPNRF